MSTFRQTHFPLCDESGFCFNNAKIKTLQLAVTVTYVGVSGISLFSSSLNSLPQEFVGLS